MATYSCKGKLIVVSGFAGSGKGTIMKQLMQTYPDNYALSISATTRNPRPGERDGIEYFFKTREEFEALIEADGFLEHACYVGNYYGTPLAYVNEQLSLGKDVILEIDMQGALQIKKKFPETILIFVCPPSFKELEKRLRGRGTETEDVIVKRLTQGATEVAAINDNYDYILINDSIDESVSRFHSIITAEHSKVNYNFDFINTFKKDIDTYVKGE